MRNMLVVGPATIAWLGVMGLGCYQGADLDRTGNEVAARRTSVLVESCVVDQTQLETLASTATRKVLTEVVLLCPAMAADGTITPSGADRLALARQIERIHALGYRVSLATTIGPSWDAPVDVHTSTTFLGDPVATSAAATELRNLAAQTATDGIDLALPQLDDDLSTRRALTTFVKLVSSAVRPTFSLGIFAPPSSQVPSDLFGGAAYDLTAVGGYLDRIRSMTLDYSCCGAPLGPTTDPGWVVDVERLARSQSASPTVHHGIAYPLYGWDSKVDGDKETPVTYGQAMLLARDLHAEVFRGPTGAPYFSYDGPDGRHQVWFDDTTSTVRAMHAWNDALPPSVDLLFYGLGAEDPTLWTALAAEIP